jgi:hypothetical protein
MVFILHFCSFTFVQTSPQWTKGVYFETSPKYSWKSLKQSLKQSLWNTYKSLKIPLKSLIIFCPTLTRDICKIVRVWWVTSINSWVFQRLPLVLRTRAILIVFEKLTRACFSPNCTRNHTITCKQANRKTFVCFHSISQPILYIATTTA